MQRQTVLAVIVLLGILVSACGSSAQPSSANSKPSGSSSSNSSAVTASSPPEAQLAAIEAGSPNPSSALIEKFRAMLDRLSKKCANNSQRNISDLIVFAQGKLKEKGVNLSLFDVASYVDKSIPDGAEVSCPEIFAAFVTLTKK